MTVDFGVGVVCSFYYAVNGHLRGIFILIYSSHRFIVHSLSSLHLHFIQIRHVHFSSLPFCNISSFLAGCCDSQRMERRKKRGE